MTLAQLRDVRDMVPAMPRVELEQVVDADRPPFRVLHCAREERRVEQAQPHDPAAVKVIEQAQ